MATISKHSPNDWCHVCGNRTDHTVDVWYPDNAEHEALPPSRYVRICGDCGEAIARIANAPGHAREERVSARLQRGKKKRTRQIH